MNASRRLHKRRTCLHTVTELGGCPDVEDLWWDELFSKNRNVFGAFGSETEGWCTVYSEGPLRHVPPPAVVR
jgi:hypothetical protein